MYYGASLFIIQSTTTKNPILWNRAQAKTGANTLNQWFPGTPEHINQHPINTKLFLSSDPLLPKITHPDLGNQVWSLRNISRTHIKSHFKVSPRIRDHGQRTPWPSEATNSG